MEQALWISGGRTGWAEAAESRANWSTGELLTSCCGWGSVNEGGVPGKRLEKGLVILKDALNHSERDESYYSPLYLTVVFSD